MKLCPLAFAALLGLALPAAAETEDIPEANPAPKITPAQQRAAFAQLWQSFADSYYDVDFDDEGPAVTSDPGGQRMVCFSFEVTANSTAAASFYQGLAKISAGDKTLFAGRETLLGISLYKETVAAFNDTGKGELGALLDWKTRVDLVLPAKRQVVLTKDNVVVARIDFSVALDRKGEGLDDDDSIHLPKRACSDWLPAGSLAGNTTASVELLTQKSAGKEIALDSSDAIADPNKTR